MLIDNWLWLAAPLTAGLLIAFILVPLGHRVLARGVVFADLAIAQWAALGSLAGMTLMPRHALAGLPVSSLLFALLAASLVHLILRLVPAFREAMIGLLYVVGASLATLLVSNHPHGAQQLAQTLSGDLLWITPSSLPWLLAMTLAVFVWQRLLSAPWQDRVFLVLFSLAVTTTVAKAGIYVVFTSLIAAPLMLCHLGRWKLWQAATVAFAGHGIGLAVSATWDYPAGPAVVLAIIGSSLLALLVSARQFPSPASVASRP